MTDFWLRTSGTWINVVTIILGTITGLLVRGRLPLRMQKIIIQAMGLVTVFISIQMATSLLKVKAGFLDGVVLAVILLAMGGVIGEWWELEQKLGSIGDWLKAKFRGGGKFTEGFVAASLLFCTGPMAIIGSLNNGLNGDNTLLVLKAIMDGLIAIAFTSSFGIGVGFSALSILVYQGSLSLLAVTLTQSLPNPAQAPPVLLITGVGGLILLGLGLNLLEVATISVASFLPALLLAPLLYYIAQGLG
jgi:uncharacterized membrane protein YqgA involved in biofilm formation